MSRPSLARFLAAGLLLSCGVASAPAGAQAVTIYRCTDASGNLTVQNTPCPAGSRQREQQVQDIPSSPAAAGTRPSSADPQYGDVQRSSDGGFVTTSSGPAPWDNGAQPVQRAADGSTITTSTGPEPRILDSANLPRTPAAQAAAPDPDRLPPPPVYRCVTYDNDSYLSEEAEVPPRCLRLRTVGLDGNPATGAGQACEVMHDQCSRVADGGACDAWRRLAREAESRWRFAHPDNVEKRRAEYERLAKIVGESCGA